MTSPRRAYVARSARRCRTAGGRSPSLRRSLEWPRHPSLGRLAGVVRRRTDVAEPVSHVQGDRDVVAVADVEEERGRAMSSCPADDVFDERVAHPEAARARRDPQRDELGGALMRLDPADHADGRAVDLRDDVVRDVAQSCTPALLGVERTRPVRHGRSERLRRLGQRREPKRTPVEPLVLEELPELDHARRQYVDAIVSRSLAASSPRREVARVPIVDPVHDLGHAVEGDTAWSESYYFNGFDPASDSGLFTRIGIRPNEGAMEVGMSIWLPGGELGEYRARKEQHTIVDTTLVVGAVTYEMLEPARAWRLTFDGEVAARPCTPAASSDRDVHVALDLRFDALSPAIGTDGTGRAGPQSPEAVAASGTVGKGHFEQAGAWSGWMEVEGVRSEWSSALGNRDRSWGPRRWGGPRMWRWFSVNVDESLHFGGIRLGTDAGDLHRGWVWDGARATSVRRWDVTTELADDALTQRVTHLEVHDKEGRCFTLHGDVQRVADIGTAGGTLVNEGLARWTYEPPDGPARVGFGICEYLHQLDAAGRPVVAVE